VTEAFSHVDGFIHLAGVLGTQETIANPGPSAETNVMGGINVLEAAAQYDVPGVYIGVGNHWMNNTYSITKTTTERLCYMYNKERGTRINVVRCVNAYGPRQLAALPFAPNRVRKVTPAFVCRALSGMPIEIYGDGSQVSDMLYVTDLANALVLALEAAADGRVSDGATEVGPDSHLSIKAIANLVAHEASFYTGNTVDVVHLPMRPGEIPGDVVSADTKTLEFLGITPASFVSLDSGIRQTVAWFNDNEGVTWSKPQA
jgi:nucleoside-diphosphate-sugar epimerase